MDWLDRSRQLIARLPIRHRETQQMSPFIFNPNQAKLFEKMREQLRTERKIRIIDLKARRVGVSSVTDALLWAYNLAFPNRNTKIVAHLAASSEELFRVPSDLCKAFPSFAHEDIQNRRIYFDHKKGRSTLSIATAGTPAAGRGGTLSALHLSEAAYFPSDDAFTSMITSVSKGDNSIVLIESTANGREGPGAAFAEFWDSAVAGRNGYIPVFLSWLDDPACVRHAEEAEDAPADDLERELMRPPFNATLEQIAWMRRTKADDCHDLEVKFLVEYPHVAEVAFQVSGSPAFAREELAYAESTVRPPIARGRLARSQHGKITFLRDDNGPLHIWEFPDDETGRPKDFKWYIGADAALGTESGDFAAYVVFNGSTGEYSARFAERIAPEVLADQLDMCGRWYHLAMVNPELTGNLGRWTLIKLRDKYVYPNIYSWKGRDDHKRGKSKSSALGFEMTQATRRLIIDAVRSCLRMGMRKEAGGLAINDRMVMSQMSLMTIKDWRWDVERGHDDVIVAMSIAVLTAAQYPPPRYRYRPKVVGEPSETEVLASIGLPTKTEMQSLVERDMQAVWKDSTKRRARNRLIGV